MSTSRGPEEGFDFSYGHFYGEDKGNLSWEYSHTTDTFRLIRKYSSCTSQDNEPWTTTTEYYCREEALALYNCMKDWFEHPSFSHPSDKKLMNDHFDLISSALYMKLSQARQSEPSGDIKIMLGDVHLGTVKDGKLELHAGELKNGDV